MIEADVTLYLISKERIAVLQKKMAFPVLPRLQECVKVRNREQGDYFAFTVVQITHREGGLPELWLKTLVSENSRTTVDYFQDCELEEYICSYEQEGWKLESLNPNRTH